MDASTMTDETTKTYDADEAVLKLACATPLPEDTPVHTTPSACPPEAVHTSSHEDSSGQPSASSPPARPEQPTPQPPRRARRTRPPSLDIFVDADPAHRPPQPKKPFGRKDGRIPLGVRKDSGNASPSPSPRDPTTPFRFRADDPFWQATENYYSPPPSPFTRSPGPSPTFGVPLPGNAHLPRSNRPRVSHSRLGPKSMVLYNLLELSDWRACSEEIRAAYRRVAMKFHPDKVVGEEMEAATLKMQQINAAKEVLLDAAARKKYHKTGKLPWSV
ncbi:DnaJ-domain-containing protein [Trematosphaeria pertusa]|uniref:DnaJ-domain-containing protein n=1 Tax=Trematosphaeria pertusa TaxID=390896 RepID=A0A6A6IKM7_9PLEO|nr:DnaJ-domain-containing protein [Trematosphaeria pertusa]KAF2250120.1 DnaJ-domain-containing protein [Trematosphaeria pertusa]